MKKPPFHIPHPHSHNFHIPNFLKHLPKQEHIGAKLKLKPQVDIEKLFDDENSQFFAIECPLTNSRFLGYETSQLHEKELIRVQIYNELYSRNESKYKRNPLLFWREAREEYRVQTHRKDPESLKYGIR